MSAAEEPTLPSAEEPKLANGYRQGFITAITVLVTASVLYFRFLTFEPGSGEWTPLGKVCVALVGLSILTQLWTLWRALQPEDEYVSIYKKTLLWFAAGVILVVLGFGAHVVAAWPR